jgi:hypothetical protein
MSDQQADEAPDPYPPDQQFGKAAAEDQERADARTAEEGEPAEESESVGHLPHDGIRPGNKADPEEPA